MKILGRKIFFFSFVKIDEIIKSFNKSSNG